MGSTKSKPNSQLTAVAMSGLNIELEDGCITNAGPGRFGDKKALDILEVFPKRPFGRKSCPGDCQHASEFARYGPRWGA